MANMSYCRFGNTCRDLADCAEHINDRLIDRFEEAGRKKVIELCKRILNEYDPSTHNKERCAIASFQGFGQGEENKTCESVATLEALCDSEWFPLCRRHWEIASAAFEDVRPIEKVLIK